VNRYIFCLHFAVGEYQILKVGAIAFYPLALPVSAITCAAHTLLDTRASLKSMRAYLQDYYGIPTVVTYHPAALLRNPQWKRPTWEDMQKLRAMLDRLRSES